MTTSLLELLIAAKNPTYELDAIKICARVDIELSFTEPVNCLRLTGITDNHHLGRAEHVPDGPGLLLHGDSDIDEE